MNSQSVNFISAVELAEFIRTKKISPVEYISDLLTHISRLEPELNAFVYFDADRVMEQAKKVESDLINDAEIGRLHGVPATIKDLQITKDMPTQYGLSGWS